MAATLYDYAGRPVDVGALRRELAEVTVTGIRSVWQDSQANGLTPGRLANILTRATQNDPHDYLTLAQEMEEREPHYASVLGTRKQAVVQLEVNLEAATDDKVDVDLRDEIEALLDRDWFSALLFDLLDALGKGYAVCEIMWDSSEGDWDITGCEWRDPRFFRFDLLSGRELRLIDEQDQAHGIPLAPYKFVRHIAKLKTGLPIRGGLARLAAVPFMCKSYTVKDWMAFAEVFGLPLRLGKYPANTASKEDQATLLNAVANLGTDAAAAIPDNMMIEILESSKTTGGDSLFQKLGDWLDKQVSKAVLGQTMTADDGSSLAQAQVHNEVRKDILRSDARQLSATINRDLIRPYIDLVHGPQEAYPCFELYIKEAQDLVALANGLTPFIDRGLRVEASVIRDKFGLPEPEADAEVLGAKAAPVQPGAGGPDQAGADAGSALNRATHAKGDPPAADDIDPLVDEALAASQRLMDPYKSALLDLVANAQTFAEMRAGLEIIGQNIDPSKLMKSLATKTFETRGMGDATDAV